MNHESRIKNKSNGFTIIEILVVISVMGIISALGIAGFSKYNDIQLVQTAANDIANTLNLAKSRALSQVKEGSNCGTSSDLIEYRVRFFVTGSADRYRLRISCVDGTSDILLKFLPKNVTFVECPPAPCTSPLIFSFPVLKGGVETAGQIVINGPGGLTKTIDVSLTGEIKIQ